MLVSLLQLMGFAQGKPVQSAPASQPGDSTVATGPTAPAPQVGARRQDVTQPTRRPPTSGARAAAAGRTPATQAAAKLSAKVPAKPPAKTVAKAAAKSVGKAAAKPAVKAPLKAVKPVAKPAAKPLPKASAKSAAKTVNKAVTKPVTKAAAKPVAKPAVKAAAKAPAKPAPKPAPKPELQVASKAKADASVAVSPSVRASSKSAQQAAAKAAAQVITKAASKTPAKPASQPSGPTAVAAPKPVLVAVAPVSAASAAASAGPAKMPGRVARGRGPIGVVFTQTPVVASTAAKTHFSPNHSLTPPPAPVTVAPKKDAKLANNWKTKSAEELTEAEVIAMPDAEYMNDKQLAFFRFKLLRLKDEILTSAGETTEHLRDDTVVVPDPADRATIEEEHALELRTRDRERKLLKKIEQSVARIDSGDYGYCDETGEPIGVPRLLARPTATLSLEAQQRRELKQKMFGD